MFTWLKQFIGIRLYICTTLVQVLSKSNFVLIVFFVYLFSSLGDDSSQAPGNCHHQGRRTSIQKKTIKTKFDFDETVQYTTQVRNSIQYIMLGTLNNTLQFLETLYSTLC